LKIFRGALRRACGEVKNFRGALRCKKKNLNENDYHYENENYSHLEVKKIGKEKIAWILKGYPVAFASPLKLSKLIRGFILI